MRVTPLVVMFLLVLTSVSTAIIFAAPSIPTVAAQTCNNGVDGEASGGTSGALGDSIDIVGFSTACSDDYIIVITYETFNASFAYTPSVGIADLDGLTWHNSTMALMGSGSIYHKYNQHGVSSTGYYVYGQVSWAKSNIGETITNDAIFIDYNRANMSMIAVAFGVHGALDFSSFNSPFDYCGITYPCFESNIANHYGKTGSIGMLSTSASSFTSTHFYNDLMIQTIVTNETSHFNIQSSGYTAMTTANAYGANPGYNMTNFISFKYANTFQTGIGPYVFGQYLFPIESVFAIRLGYNPVPPPNPPACGPAVDGTVGLGGTQWTLTDKTNIYGLQTSCGSDYVVAVVYTTSYGATTPTPTLNDSLGDTWHSGVMPLYFGGNERLYDGAGYYTYGSVSYAKLTNPVSNYTITVTENHGNLSITAFAFAVHNASTYMSFLTPFDMCASPYPCLISTPATSNTIANSVGVGSATFHPTVDANDLVIESVLSNKTSTFTPSTYYTHLATSQGFGIMNFTTSGNNMTVYSAFEATNIIQNGIGNVGITNAGHASMAVFAIPLNYNPITPIPGPVVVSSSVIYATVSCTFFQQQCWWFPMIVMGSIIAFFVAGGIICEVSSKGLMYLLLVGFAFGAMISLLMGMLGFEFIVFAIVLLIIFAWRMRDQ